MEVNEAYAYYLLEMLKYCKTDEPQNLNQIRKTISKNNNSTKIIDKMLRSLVLANVLVWTGSVEQNQEKGRKSKLYIFKRQRLIEMLMDTQQFRLFKHLLLNEKNENNKTLKEELYEQWDKEHLLVVKR